MLQPSTPEKLAEKATRYLRWSIGDYVALVEAGASGTIEDAERAFSQCLSNLSVVSDSLRKASKALGTDARTAITDDGAIEGSALHYLKHARHADVHHVLSFDFNATHFKLHIVSDARTKIVLARNRRHADDAWALVMFAYNVRTPLELKELFAQRVPPDKRLCIVAGIKIDPPALSIGLQGFRYFNDWGKGNWVDVPEPTTHLGVPVSPVAIPVLHHGMEYYLGKLTELVHFLGVELPLPVLPEPITM